MRAWQLWDGNTCWLDPLILVTVGGNWIRQVKVGENNNRKERREVFDFGEATV